MGTISIDKYWEKKKLSDKNSELKSVATFSSAFIKQTAAVAAMGCFGVIGLAYKNLFDEILSTLRFRYPGKGVKIKSLSGNRIEIDLYVIMEFGTRLVAVADSLIDVVKYSVEKQTAVDVARVNVHVQYVRV
jgi:uncharacterized alkaline shock family protein YloU